MRYWKKAVLILILAALVFCGAAPAASAEEVGTTQTETTSLDSARETLYVVTGTNPEDADVPVTQLQVPEAKYYKDFTYGSNVIFSGIYKTHKLYFQIPEYWDSQYVYAQIEAELSQLIQNVPASLTFMVNETPVATYKMDYASGSTQVFFVEIPLELVNEGYNSFDITGYVRLYDDDGCIDDFSGANWISVRGTSFVQVGYDVKPSGQRISAYPYPFLSSLDETGSGTAILVSDWCDVDELTAALMLRADLGSETELEDAITLARISDSTGDENYRIVIGLQSNLDAHYRSIAQSVGEDLSTQALVHFYVDGDVETLLITSDSGEALMEAAMMLMDESRVSQEKYDTALVRENAADGIRSQIGSTLEAGRMTLDSLLDSGLSFVGPFHQEGDIYLPFSGGYVLAESGMVDLKFRYSENLDFDRSMITVYWGDIPVSSKRLTKENAGGDTLSFTMPDDVVGTYAGKITIAFELELPDLFCTPRMDEMPWAYVTSDSSFYLPVGTGSSYTFGQRPYPFEVSSRFNELNVVIPEHITAAELNTLGRVIALYGEQPSPYGDLRVTYANDLIEELDEHGTSIVKEGKNDNLIVIGTYADNSMIRELNPNLSFRYSDTGSNFLSNDAMVLSDHYAREIATMQLFPSPYADGRAVMVVGTLDDTGMQNLHSFLSQSSSTWKMEKDTILIDADQQIRTFELAEKKTSTSTPILKRMLESNQEAAIFTLVATGVMVLLLLMFILILIRLYWRQKK